MTAEFHRKGRLPVWVKTGTALTERNISAEPSRPDICASRIGETLPGTSSGTSASVDRNIWPTAIFIIGLSHDLDATTGSVASAPMPAIFGDSERHSAALSIVRRDAVANTVRQRITFGRAAAATADQRGPGLAESHSEGTAAVLRAGGVASGTSELSDSPSGSASPSSGSVGASNKAASPIVARRST